MNCSWSKPTCGSAATDKAELEDDDVVVETAAVPGATGENAVTQEVVAAARVRARTANFMVAEGL